jgi:hypothetical protein
MPNWTMNEPELREARIPDHLESCMMRTRNWIQSHSYTDDNIRLITSSSEVTSMVEKAKTLTVKEKTGHTQAISSIASWKEGIADESHLYKKHKTQESA